MSVIQRSSVLEGRRSRAGSATVTEPILESLCNSRKCDREHADSSSAASARESHLVVTHLLDVVHERANRLEEVPELSALPKTRHVPLLGVPLDPDHVLRRIFAAA